MDSGMDSYRRFLSGDNSGLEEIICVYKDGLILYLHGVVNDLQLAEELTENTFVKLVVKRPRFSQQSAFKTWLYTISLLSRRGCIPSAETRLSTICGEAGKRNCHWMTACRSAMTKKT